MICPRCKKEHNRTTKFCETCIEYQSKYRTFKKSGHLQSIITPKKYMKDTQFLLSKIDQATNEGIKKGLEMAIEIVKMHPSYEVDELADALEAAKGKE